MSFYENYIFLTKSWIYSYDHMKNDTKNDLRNLGALIKSERKKRRLTQTQLGEISETSINFISQIESGKASAHIGKVFRVIQVLGFELHVLRGSKGVVILTPNQVKNV